ncbi:MAG: hypothetical protein K5931_01725 [Lachnospiraceae bacterium]|nr:hypothetical protein [Lachnospiraceae bacterium]
MNFLPSTIAFILVVMFFFYLAAPKYRGLVLLTASLLFCYGTDSSAFLFLIISTSLAWIFGNLLNIISEEKPVLRKALYIFSILFFIGSLLLFKSSWTLAARLNSDNFKFLWLIILPVGFSFYAFQAISYLTDIYIGKIKAEKNPVNFFLYMFWFPKWISGPIERAENIMPAINSLSEVRLFNGSRIIRSLSYFIWGLFMKLVLADRISIFVDAVYLDYSKRAGLTLLFAAILYSIQIYCDFAGYTNIMIGISELFGIPLSPNFNAPYLASNISEFWRSWHMTLSSFLRDYIYIPLGGNRKGSLKKYINIMIVFIVCGFWHGNGVKFLVWGLLHGIFSVISNILLGSSLKFLVKGAVGTLINFALVTFAWIFFRVDSFSQAIDFIIRIPRGITSFSGLMKDFALIEDLKIFDIWIFIIALIILIFADIRARSKESQVADLICKTGEVRRDLIFLIMTLIILIFGQYGETDVGKFIYMDF